jgi:predicted MPP superfamily phosphohydrolase
VVRAAINPDKAWQGVNPELPIVCLNHNPVNAKELLTYPWQWMLAGPYPRAAGRDERTGKRLYPKRYRHYTHGHYVVEGRHLYVNRGLSYGQRVLDWCRPEITVFKLTAATEAEASAAGPEAPVTVVPGPHSAEEVSV